MAVLGAALYLTLIFDLWPRGENVEHLPSEDAQESVSKELPPPSEAIPETLTLECRRDYDFGNWPLGVYHPDLSPLLKDPAWIQNHCRWVGSFEQEDTATALELAWVDLKEKDGNTYYLL